MAQERPPVEPDLRRLAIIELGFLILAVGIVLVLRAQFFEVRVQGNFARPDNALQSGWVVLAGIVALCLGSMFMAGALMPKRRFRPTTFVAYLGLALSLVGFVVLVMPVP